MKNIRNKSILTGGEIEELFSIKKFPIFIGASDKDHSNDIFSDLTFDICKESGLIQLRKLIDPNLIYSEFHSEAIGDIWETHHNLFSNLILKYQKNNKILEIGGSDSRLALRTLDKVNDIQEWTIIEPNLKTKYDISKLKYINGFFDKNTKMNFDMVVHSHTLEHMYDPENFLKILSNKLEDENYHIFSVPNLYEYLMNNYINTINFEHTLFLTEEIIDYLLSKHNFKIIDKSFYKDHSIFYVTKKKKTKTKKLHNNYRKYKKLYLNYADYYKDFVKKLNKELEKTKDPVYLFGAHIFSQYLIMLGLNTSKIECILDNSEAKIGKRLYGTNMIIKSPNDVKLEHSLVILKVGQYRHEIMNQLLDLEKSIKFYE